MNRAFIIFLILAIGFYLRAGGVLRNSFAFTYDVGRDMLQVQNIVRNFDIPLIGQTTGLGGLYYGPWWYYLLTPVFVISGGSPQGIAFFMVLTGLLTIILGYILGERIGGRALGLLIASFIGISDVMVGLSSQIWNPNIIPPLLLLLLLSIQKYIKGKTIRISLFIGLLLGFMFDLEIVFGALLAVGFIVSYVLFFRKKILDKSLIFIGLGFLITILPRIAFEMRHQFIMTLSLFKPHTQEQQILNIPSFFVALPDRITTVMGQIGDTFGASYQLGIVISLGVLLIWYFLRKKAKKEEVNMFHFSAVVIAVFILGSSIFARAIWGHYLVGLPVLYIVVVSIALALLTRKAKVLGIIAFFLLLVLSSKPQQLISNIKNPNWEGNAAVYRNQVAVIDYIYKDAKGRKFNYIAYTPVVHDYTYQYLFIWYGNKQYGYSPKKETEKLLYVIIEPDPGYEGRIVDWLNIREGDGKTINEKIIKGGIKVQTRSR